MNRPPAGPSRGTTRCAVRPRRSGCGSSLRLTSWRRLRRQHDREAGAPRPGRLVQLDAAAVGLGDGAYDREPEARAVRRRAGRRARRSVEDAVLSCAGDARALSRTQRRTTPSRSSVPIAIASPAGVLRRRSAPGRPSPASAGGGRRTTRRRRARRAPSRASPSAGTFANSSSVSTPTSTVSRSRKSGCSAFASRSRSLTMRPIRSSSSRTSATVSRPLLRVVAQQLEVAADDRDRRAQLVAGVVEEGALVRRRLKAVEHRVERARQVGKLVVALRPRSAARDPSR